MGRKNLDQLFQEKFKDFSEEPDEKIWQRIAVTLDQKKKSRRLIPIWWKVGGVAAVLAFLIFTISPFESFLNEENEGVTNVQKEEEEDQSQSERNILKNADSSGDKVVGEGRSEQESRETIPSVPTDRSSTPQVKEAVVVSKAQKNSISETHDPSSVNAQTEVAGRDTATPLPHNERKEDIKNDEKERAIFKNKGEAPVVANTDGKENDARAGAIEKKEVNAEAENLKPNLGETGEAVIVQNEEKNTDAVEANAEKKSLFDEIEEDELEEALEDPSEKWAVGANVAPVYFNSFGEGSPIHSSFVSNSKSGEINMSYGLSVSYQISKKLRIRSGISKVDYGYNTNDVEFSSSLASSTNGEITNIDYARTSANLVVESTKTNNGLVEKDAFVEIARDGVMAQHFGYLEIPMELNYALIDRKFGVDLVGGVSSLFLVDNSVALSSGELTTDVGKANNINNVNFSTNIGFGLNYKLTPKIQMNVEPVFKYQLNTFSNTSGNFQPFSIGVYSGLNFKF